MITEQFEALPIEEVGMIMQDQHIKVLQDSKKEYPPFDIQRGVLVKKKVKYSNLEQEDVRVRFESSEPELCSVNDIVEIPATNHDFLRLKILVPNNHKENQIDVEVTAFNDATNLVISKIIFHLHLTD